MPVNYTLPREETKNPISPIKWRNKEAQVFIDSVKALATGTASEHQQQLFMDVLINDLCGTYDLEYRRGETEAVRDSAVAAGKRWVGLQLVAATRINPRALGETHVDQRRKFPEQPNS